MGIVNNVADFVHGIHQRQLAANVSGAEKNFLNDPQGTIKSVYQIDPASGMALQNAYAKQQKDAQDAADALNTTKSNRFTSGVSLLHGLPDGVDPMHAIDALGPTFKAAGYTDDDINGIRTAVQANPGIINATDKERWKYLNTPQVVAPGSDVVTGGQVTIRNPLAPKVNVVGSDKTGRNLVVTDIEPGGTAQPAAAPTPSAPAGGMTIAGRDPYAPILGAEGGTDPRTGAFRTSPKGAVGPGQIMPATGPEAAAAAGLPWDPARYASDPDYNQAIGRAYHAVQLARFGGDEPTAAAAYNAGPGRVSRIVGVPGGHNMLMANFNKLPAETQAYVRKVAPGVFGGGGGSTSVPAAPAAAPSGGSRVAFSQAPVASGFRAATPQELAAAGYPAGTAAQVGPDGKLANLKTPAAGQQGKNAFDPVIVQSRAKDTIDSLNALADEADSLANDKSLSSATGVLDSRLPTLFQGTKDFENRFGTLKGNIGLNALKNLKSLSATGASGFGNLSDKEGARLDNSMGSLDLSSGTSLTKTNLGKVSAQARQLAQRVHETTQQAIAEHTRGAAPAAEPGLKPGHVEGGFVYVGGDPANQRSWRKK